MPNRINHPLSLLLITSKKSSPQVLEKANESTSIQVKIYFKWAILKVSVTHHSHLKETEIYNVLKSRILFFIIKIDFYRIDK